MKYFVYTSAKDEYEFIEEPSIEQFAKHEYNPSTMIFTGVAIEASDLGTALDIYQNPGCGKGEYMMSEEPQCTVLQRQTGNNHSVEAQMFRLEYLRCMVKMKQAGLYMQTASNIVREVSNNLHKMYKSPDHTTPAEIFDDLSQSLVKGTMNYDGNPKES